MFEIKGKHATALVTIDFIEDDCITQIRGILDHPLYDGSSIVIMPDTHSGKGSVIGFTCTLNGRGICVNIVGVDICCGMNCWKITPPTDLPALDRSIRSVIPLGSETHAEAVSTMEANFPWEEADSDVRNFVDAFNRRFGTGYVAAHIDYAWFTGLCSRIVAGGQTATKFRSAIDRSIGTLGGGNHFIEVSVDKEGQHYLIVHSGSRNFGKRVADYYQKRAESQEHNQGQNRDLAYLQGQEMMDYLVVMVFMKHFAALNRRTMGNRIGREAGLALSGMIETIHNFIDHEDFTLRKGAIRSYAGELMIIPFNMRDGSWICEGRSNPAWNLSAPHGAGRLMSRTDAMRVIRLDEFREQMKGIFTTSVDINTIDEAPDSYKPAALIQAAIQPTATIIHQLKPVYNLKSSEEHPPARKKRGEDRNLQDNSPDAIWARFRTTIPKKYTENPEDEAAIRKMFETDRRATCKKYRV
ncbi:MAG: RtcB family protein [Methanoregula sp.]|nr:RtcB family protein [Methanoregula sp.]